MLDFLPREASASQVRAAMFAVREGGRVVLMGGVRGTGGADLARIYNWLKNNTTLRGAWMYPREAIPRMAQMVRAGLIDLTQYEMTEFALDEVNDRPGPRRQRRSPGAHRASPRPAMAPPARASP